MPDRTITPGHIPPDPDPSLTPTPNPKPNPNLNPNHKKYMWVVLSGEYLS